MNTADLFAGAVRTEAELRELYPEPKSLSVRKVTTGINEMTRRFIAASPFVLVASHSREGLCDVSPRGGPPGFVSVLDETCLAIPDATGNRRLDSMRNVVQTGQVGLLFLIPGRGQTLRINGRACVSTDPELLARLTAVGRPPLTALVVRADEVFAHCPKAFVRSGLWDPATWPGADADLPSPAELSQSHIGDPNLTVAEVEEHLRNSLIHDLA